MTVDDGESEGASDVSDSSGGFWLCQRVLKCARTCCHSPKTAKRQSRPTFSNPPDLKRLSSQIDPHMLKAVPLECAMAMFGAHWAASSSLSVGSDLAETVTNLDDFISHDWQTGRWAKFIALSLWYNGRAAVMASVSVGVVVSTLELMMLDDVGSFESTVVVANTVHFVDRPLLHCIICPSCFIVVLSFGQRFLSCLYSRRMVFVDKLCIDQTNPEKKQAGILGLAGFIKRSSKLNVLWSRRYFTRLWCTYELASWIHHGKKMGSVNFLPVARAQALGVLLMCSALFWSFNECRDVVQDPSDVWWYVGMRVGGSCLVALVLPVRMLLLFVQEMRSLPEQLDTFSIRGSRCFCCDSGHMQPDTGDHLPCDRELVYMTLDAWFGGPATSRSLNQNSPSSFRETHLDEFDRRVRAGLKDRVTRGTGLGGTLSFRAVLFSATPLLWHLVVKSVVSVHAVSVHAFEPLVAARLIAEDVVTFLTDFPCWVSFIFHGVSWSEQLPRRCSDNIMVVQDMLVRCCISVAAMTGATACSLPLWLACRTAGAWSQGVASVVIIVITALLYQRRIWRSRVELDFPDHTVSPKLSDTADDESTSASEETFEDGSEDLTCETCDNLDSLRSCSPTEGPVWSPYLRDAQRKESCWSSFSETKLWPMDESEATPPVPGSALCCTYLS